MSNILPTMFRETTDILLWGGLPPHFTLAFPLSTATLTFGSATQTSLLSLDGLTASVPGCPSARHSSSQGVEYTGSIPPSQLQAEAMLLAAFPIQQSAVYPPFPFSTYIPSCPCFLSFAVSLNLTQCSSCFSYYWLYSLLEQKLWRRGFVFCLLFHQPCITSAWDIVFRLSINA